MRRPSRERCQSQGQAQAPQASEGYFEGVFGPGGGESFRAVFKSIACSSIFGYIVAVA